MTWDARAAIACCPCCCREFLKQATTRPWFRRDWRWTWARMSWARAILWKTPPCGRGYAELLVRLLQSSFQRRRSSRRPQLEVALQLLEAAGGELAPGAPQAGAGRGAGGGAKSGRIAEYCQKGPTAKAAASRASAKRVCRRWRRGLNFVVPGDDADQTAQPGDRDEAAAAGGGGVPWMAKRETEPPVRGPPRPPSEVPPVGCGRESRGRIN